MDTTTLPPQVGEVLEKGQQSAVNTAQQVVSDVSTTVSDQVGLRNETNAAQTQPLSQNPAQNAPSSEPTNQASQEDLEMTKEMVRDYYSPSQTASNKAQAELEEQQRQVQLAATRQKLAQELHNENYFNQIGGQSYYSEILNAGAPRAQAGATEEEQMEEVRNEDKMQDLQVAQKKNEDLARFRAQRQVEIKGDIVG